MGSDQIVDITEFRAGSGLFESRGAAYIKVTRDGAKKALRIPIKSTGVTEAIERQRRNEPRPRATVRTIKADDPEARGLSFPKGAKHITVREYDFTDPEYQEARNVYEEDLALDIIDQGLDVPIKDDAGNVVTERDKKIAILKSMGMSMNQFSELVSAVQELTRMTEKDREDFFGASSTSEETPSA